jgi:hypothetical protein
MRALEEAPNPLDSISAEIVIKRILQPVEVREETGPTPRKP